MEDLSRSAGLRSVALRYFNAAGADPESEIGERHDPETHLIPLAIYSALGIRDALKIFGTDYPTMDGTCIRDYIHVNDLADAHIKAVEYLMDKDRSDSFNLGNGIGHSVREVVNAVKKISGRDFEVIEADRREGDPPVLISDYRKAEEILGWRPQYADINAIVETAYRWHLKDR
jgi:UDP-glucose 4-epimerase